VVLQGILSVFFFQSLFLVYFYSSINSVSEESFNCFLVLLLFYCPRGCNTVDINLLLSFFRMVPTSAPCNNVGLAVV
jgi:hypothetical protein